MAVEGMQFPWWWNGGTVFPNLDVIWEILTLVVIRESRFRRAGGDPTLAADDNLHPPLEKCTHHGPTPMFPWLKWHCSKRKLHDVSYRAGL